MKKRISLDYKLLDKKVNEMIKHMSVKCKDRFQQMDELSGGNQQKVVIGKSLLIEPRLLILDQPTRGVDVGAKSEIYDLVTDTVAESDTSILYISDELEELMALCDRIYVIKQGTCVREIDNHTQDVTKAMLLKDMVD